MSDNSKIEWTEATWNPITGCSVVSPGCTNCYAMRLAGTRLKHHPSRAGLTQETKAGPVWTGEVRLNEQWLDQPIRWRKPRLIFVCAHGDLFAEGVPDEWIDRVFAVMALAPQHTFQVLTKRAERMHSYFSKAWGWRVIEAKKALDPDHRPGRGGSLGTTNGALENVWLGVSVEDQTRADERIPLLLDTPAAVRWISAEPLLGPVRLDYVARPGFSKNNGWIDALTGEFREVGYGSVSSSSSLGKRIDWIVCGGESGPHARPMNPQWARDLRDQCSTAGVPFFHKQNGEWRSASECEGDDPIHAFNDHRAVRRVGKKRAGRLLDGRLHDEMPVAPA